MDSGDLERERGITITSKVTTVEYNGTLLNVVDSPGHSEYVRHAFHIDLQKKPSTFPFILTHTYLARKKTHVP